MRLSPEQLEQIVTYTELGLGCEEIARRIGCCKTTVSRVRRLRDVPVRRSYRLTPEQLARAEELLADGASFAEAARSIGATTSAVAKRFPGHGWTHQECGAFTAMLRRIDEIKVPA